jgi:hypothetical protein
MSACQYSTSRLLSPFNVVRPIAAVIVTRDVRKVHMFRPPILELQSHLVLGESYAFALTQITVTVHCLIICKTETTKKTF